MNIKTIHQRIFDIRGMKVMLDFHLAELYSVETKALKRSVKRNLDRFPSDFMFELSTEEWENLRYHFGTSSWGGSRYLPFAFTEQGVAMLSSVLHSPKAIQANIAIMRAFVAVRQFALNFAELEEKIKALEEKYDARFRDIFEALNFLMNAKQKADDFKKRTPIGFNKSNNVTPGNKTTNKKKS
jgi:hypothetical protein